MMLDLTIKLQKVIDSIEKSHIDCNIRCPNGIYIRSKSTANLQSHIVIQKILEIQNHDGDKEIQKK